MRQVQLIEEENEREGKKGRFKDKAARHLSARFSDLD
jgi:hypothetical protein